MNTLDRLIELADKSTKGFWFFNRECGLHILTIPKAEPHIIASEVKLNDGRFIQAAQPDTVKQLCELVKEAADIIYEHSPGHTVWIEKFEQLEKGNTNESSP